MNNTFRFAVLDKLYCNLYVICTFRDQVTTRVYGKHIPYTHCSGICVVHLRVTSFTCEDRRRSIVMEFIPADDFGGQYDEDGFDFGDAEEEKESERCFPEPTLAQVKGKDLQHR